MCLFTPAATPASTSQGQGRAIIKKKPHVADDHIDFDAHANTDAHADTRSNTSFEAETIYSDHIAATTSLFLPVPLELLPRIISFLPPTLAFQLATSFRLPFLQLQFLPLIPCASIDNASRRARIDLLNFWVENTPNPAYTADAIDTACRNGHIHVLNWWKESSQARGLEFKYDERAMDEARDTDVLEWWLRSGFELKYTYHSMDNASERGDVNILQWWKDARANYPERNIELQYTYSSMDCTTFVSVLEWWRTSGLHLLYSELAMDEASEFEAFHLLDWWKNSGLALEYTEQGFDMAAEYGKTDVLQWWLDSGLEVRYSANAIDDAAGQGSIATLNFFEANKERLEFRCTERAMDDATRFQQVLVLDWFRTHIPNEELKYSANGILEAMKTNRDLSVIWWAIWLPLDSPIVEEMVQMFKDAKVGKNMLEACATVGRGEVKAAAKLELMQRTNCVGAECADRVMAGA
ncbi:hypothetical protein BC832DRAFT_559673 [Gaertneriomyces semiglobifer]|nr:hypothetical protein BC832DRAFT_559673 [Gaertneriomyces semiglobifer]